MHPRFFNLLTVEDATKRRCCGPENCGRRIGAEDASERFCIANACMAWAWAYVEDSDATVESMVTDHAVDRVRALGAVDEAAILAALEIRQEEWQPRPPDERRPWALSRKFVDDEFQLRAVFVRDKDPAERWGYCGYRGRCAEFGVA